MVLELVGFHQWMWKSNTLTGFLVAAADLPVTPADAAGAEYVVHIGIDVYSGVDGLSYCFIIEPCRSS